MKNQHSHKQYQQQEQLQPNDENQASKDRSPSSIHHQKQKQSTIAFSSSPVLMKCPFCLHRMQTQIIRKPELISIMLGLLMFTIIPNAIMIIIIVIVLQLTATLKHRCSACEKQLGSDGKYLLVFTDQIYSFSFKESGILISKKILMTIGIFLLVLVIIFVRNNIERSHQWTELKWNEYIQECPYNNMSSKCGRDHMGKTIKNWKGFVMRVEDRRQSIRRFYDYAVQLYVKMDPQQRDSKTPDLYLTGSSSDLYDLYQIFDQLRHGDQIVFNATFQQGKGLGQEVKNRHLNIVDLNKTGNRNESVQVYLSKKEQAEYRNRVWGKALRREK